MSSLPSFVQLYQTFHPDNKAGIAKLIELFVFIRGGAISITTLVSILQELNESICPHEVDYCTLIERNCHNLSFVIVDGLVKCKFRNR